jgi:GT2 family glycosyltransferase
MTYLLRGLAVTLTLALWVLTAEAPAAQHASAAHSSVLTTFRVDVSRRPQIGTVVTLPGLPKKLDRSAVTVRVGRGVVHPSVRRLSPNDIQLVLSPDLRVPTAALALERAAAIQFLVGLPAGAETAVTFMGRPTADPTVAVASLQQLSGGRLESAGARLTAALSAFASGASVRRTVVLALSADEQLSRAARRQFGQQLAASGTQLYVLDASPGGAPGLDALAAGSGGRAVRIRAPRDWATAFRGIAGDLDSQYYVRFTDPLPLPSGVLISVRTATGRVSRVVSLPAINPTAPQRPASAPSEPLQGLPLGLLALVAVGLVIAHGLGMLAASRREPRSRIGKAQARTGKPLGGAPGAAAQAASVDPQELFFVFLVPCLNEEKVIRNSLQRLLALPGDSFALMVVDDGSEDNTADVVSSIGDDRVWLLRRTPPNARQGKGAALNAAISQVTGNMSLQKRDLDNVIVVVVDADGRLDPHSLAAVTPYFAESTVGAVQIGVRINNRGMSRLARMQDMEFVIFTEVFQRGRRHLGSVGLGGNGQFMRLSALRSLGEAPWSHSLTEDLDLGIRLLTAGWRNEYCHTAAVHQQGVIELRRLLRQRSRWFQGHLQSWKLVPAILRAAPRRARADLLYHLSSPAILLIASVLTTSFVCSLAGNGFIAAQGGDPVGWWLATTYLLAFGPALLQSSTYWLRERENGVSVGRTAVLAHIYVCYSLMWYAAGWWAVGRTLRRRTNWAKTERVAEAPLPAVGQIAFAPLSPAPAGAPSPLFAASHPGAPLPTRPAGSAPTGRPDRRRQWRNRWIVSAAAVVILVLGVALPLLDGGRQAQPTQWYQVFSGYGHPTVSGSGAGQEITLSVAKTHSKQVTHAALVLSRRWYRDFVASAQVRTVRQLRTGRAGTPNPWEVGWVVWHYSSPQHFYALTLEPNGWSLSKQDPAYPGGERFLASAMRPRFWVGTTHRVGIAQIGNQITVAADGHLLAKFIDTERTYLSGGFGFYAEDSVARFNAIRLQSLLTTASYPAKHPPGAAR